MTPRRPRRPRIEVANPFFDPFGLCPPASLDELKAATYRQCLKWCADRQGILLRDRLRHVAKARDNHPKWIDRLVGRHIDDVLADATSWQRRQRVE
jgi:hypothetical protein